MSGPRVIREGGGVVAVWKPAGLATQAPPGVGSAEAWLRERLHGGRAGGYLGVPHRLDRAVSGVVLFAATPRAARQLSRQFERRQVTKRYLAIVAGHRLPGAESAAAAGAGDGGAAAFVDWHDTVEKIPEEARARIVAPDAAGGRAAHTRARLLRGLPEGGLLLELLPVTGRMHQLRLQAAARGSPVRGDELYGGGDGEWSARVAAAEDVWRDAAAAGTTPAIALHAARIEYACPDGGGPVAVGAGLPGYWPAAVSQSPEAVAVTTA
jgi:23S rRNA pseudouridine1911/1915/1917 synthase